jgi:hypothetical protein
MHSNDQLLVARLRENNQQTFCIRAVGTPAYEFLQNDVALLTNERTKRKVRHIKKIRVNILNFKTNDQQNDVPVGLFGCW